MTMENFEEMIFDDEEFFDDELNSNQDLNTQDPNDLESLVDVQNEEDDLTNEVLRLKGIADPNKIKFEEETGAIIERSWDSLSREEQLNILSDQNDPNFDLDDQEVELLNAIRSSGMSVHDYMSALTNSVQPKESYKIDQLSDEEVYALDLLEKVGSDNITDEELEQAIENAKQNETLFKKTVEGLRNEYIRLQKDEELQVANEKALKQEQAYNNFVNSITTEIRGLNSFAGQSLELSEEDVEDLASFMLDLDEFGLSQFGKALQDPALLTKAAFWILNEDQIIEELTRQMQDNYKRGYETAKADLNGKSKIVFNKSNITSQKKQHDNVFVDDEDW